MEFVKGQEKPPGSGRKPGVRNKLNHAFLEAFAADFEAHGIETIRIVRMERPHEYLKVAAFLMPKAFDDELPARLLIVTGVPRNGDYADRPPSVPGAGQQTLADLSGKKDEPRED